MSSKLSCMGIVQARMGSTRLPGKVLLDLGGKPMIRRLLDRLKHSEELEDIVVATTINERDDELEDYLAKQGVTCFRGDENDVLSRFHSVAKIYSPDIIVRITADDPLKDHRLIDRGVRLMQTGASIDYVSNTLEPTWPEGLDVEVIRYEALRKAHEEATLVSEREHVTPYIWKNNNLFNCHNFKWRRNLSHWRWTVDKPADLELMRRIFCDDAYRSSLSYETIVEWMDERQEMLTINSGTIRNEGYLRSVHSEV